MVVIGTTKTRQIQSLYDGIGIVGCGAEITYTQAFGFSCRTELLSDEQGIYGCGEERLKIVVSGVGVAQSAHLMKRLKSAQNVSTTGALVTVG